MRTARADGRGTPCAGTWSMPRRFFAVTVALLVACSPAPDPVAAGAQTAQATPLPTGTLDELLAPIALYPDSLLAQMLMSATDAAKITELDKWMKAKDAADGEDADPEDTFYDAKKIFETAIAEYAKRHGGN